MIESKSAEQVSNTRIKVTRRANSSNLDRFRPASRAARAERKEIKRDGLNLWGWQWFGRVSNLWKCRLYPFRRFVPKVHAEAEALTSLSDQQLKARIAELRRLLRSEGFTDPVVAKAFALIREASGRTLGMRHFDSQIIGGRVILSGMLAEMQTGEGKTLTAALPAATAALAGVPVHVVSANDYLTARDAEEMTPVYRFLGLSVGCVTGETDHKDRPAQYDCDITYCSNKDLTFDYLRDLMALDKVRHNLELQASSLYEGQDPTQQVMQRGLHFVILDEADSVLIDDAKTPLIISANRGGEEEETFLRQAWQLAQQLEEKVHYVIHRGLRSLFINNAGREKIAELCDGLGPLWVGKIRREEVVRQALTARELFHKDQHYIISDEDKIHIVDENTGRVMPDRAWERGLHQLIEIKEGVEVSKQRETLAKISYQRFFRRYIHLSGMTGTAREVRNELWTIYGMRVMPIPTHQPSKRQYFPVTVCETREQHWQAIIKAIEDVNDTGRPILVGTCSVAASEHLSELLTDHGLEHQLLNAKQDQQEASIVAQAGMQGRITVATNMAGRGTDIKLEREVKDLGGLHVILMERFEAGRVDRQLAGRCARQGDPGSYQEILCVEDIESTHHDLNGMVAVVSRILGTRYGLGRWFGVWAIRVSQKRLEKRHEKMRITMLKQDEQQRELLAFTGILE
ncbi:preprotein translocase subunit SecA [Litoribrevibacter euphylliae]|uniref:Protein translocase subunit SecA n=1 Tax=Litoribrevibacter euphylliae TaxID=1834034 RepID=A0ABV7HFW0_9GAMM